MSIKVIGHLLLSAVFGVLICGMILLVVLPATAVLVAGPSAAADPEAVGLIVLVLEWSIPGTVLGVCIAGLLDYLTTFVSRGWAMFIAIIASGAVSGAIFLLVVAVALAGHWNEFPLELAIPAVLCGLLGAGVYERIGRKSLRMRIRDHG